MNDDEKLDLLFQYLESFKDSDKGLNQFLADLAEIRPELSDTIDEFIKTNADAENWFSALAGSLDEVVEEKDVLKPGERIGAFRVLERLGNGGMSQVYKAERVDGHFEQTVAVKILDAPLNESHQELFNRVKDILARLAHPNIAQIYDGGIMTGGKPFYVMEFIDGVAVDQYVKENELSEKEIIDLILSISRAVNFAHQNLIVHKDIKPQNIIVDTYGVVKLLDFGIADSLSTEEEETKEISYYATPGYISPEMLNNNPVNTTSDIYQMGLVLHKLITNKNPQGYSDTLSNDIVIEEGLIQSKELTAIIRKTLRKNPEERFQSVDGLIHELENYLSCRPVDTYSNGRVYLIKKFIRRNRRLSRITALFLLLVIALTSFYILNLKHERAKAEANAMEAKQEANRAQATVKYLKNVFYQADPFLKKHRASRMMDSVLVIAHEQLKSNLPEQPITKAEVLIALGDIFMSRNMYEKSFEVNREALFILDDETAHNATLHRARVYSALAVAHTNYNYIDSSEFYIQKALASDSSDTSVDNEHLSYDLETLGRIYAIKRDYSNALKYYNQAIARYKRSSDVDSDILIAGAKSMIGEINSRIGKYDEAESYILEALQIHRNKLGERNAYVLNDYGKLTELYLNVNNYEESMKYAKKSLELTKKIYGDSSLQLINDLKFLGSIYSETGDYDQAIKHGNDALKLSLRNYGKTHFKTANTLNDLGMMHIHAGKIDEAINYLRKSLHIKEQLSKVDSSSLVISKYNLANVYLKNNKSEKAAEMLEEVYGFERRAYGDENVSVAITMRLLAQAYIDNNELNKGKSILNKCTTVMESSYDSINRRLGELNLTWAHYYLKTTDYNQSLRYAEKAFRIYEALYADNHWRTAYSSALCAYIAYQQGQWGKVEKQEYLKNIRILNKQYDKRSYYIQKIWIENIHS